jgi:hypothetical protein
VVIKLEFVKPWEATNTTTFTFVPEGANTQVTWLMAGHNNFAAKVFGVFMNMDEMVGKDFEKGLAQLNTVAEAEAKKRAAEAQAKAAEAAPPAPAAPTQAPAPTPPKAQ